MRISKTTWQLILIGLVILLFNSCQTAKQLIDKAEKKDPAAVAQYTRDKYPCTDLLKPDTAVIYQDSIVYIDCPDTATVINEYTTRVDTVKLPGSVRTIKVPVHIPIVREVITKWYEDSAKLKLYSLQVQGLQGDTARLNSQVDKYKGKLHTRNKEALWLLILVILLLIWTFRKLFKFLL